MHVTAHACLKAHRKASPLVMSTVKMNASMMFVTSVLCLSLQREEGQSRCSGGCYCYKCIGGFGKVRCESGVSEWLGLWWSQTPVRVKIHFPDTCEAVYRANNSLSPPTGESQMAASIAVSNLSKALWSTVSV